MDIGGEGVLPPNNLENEAEQRSNINISDVFEAISIADPSFGAGAALETAADAGMYRPPATDRPAAYVRIVEQPASKALRFRYECEGRSAGSIPGASSTPEKKTFPTIEICGHKGRAVVVVSCVTKDKPYRPHPHNLVGRELCKRGVCTVNVAAESGVVPFSNLGIQCVKRRDIEDALRLREEMRVDPFKTGFSHKNQPQGIDLNAVRLCFQVFLPDERSGKIRHALPPVVSEVIYDKKAMSDLIITRLSHCSASVEGGKQIILLCEKVAREDIAVTFFVRTNGAVTWQADAGDVLVHKQVAICCSTPQYRDVDTVEHVQAFIQLRRPSDNATSEALQFELLPLTAGTKRKRPVDLTFLNSLLSECKRTNIDGNNNKNIKTIDDSSESSVNCSDESGSANIAEISNSNISDNDETLIVDVDQNDKSLNELLDQVAELDEIYSENRTRLENVVLTQHSEDTDDFNDAGTYTSLQLAFKNPIEISEPDNFAYEDVQTFRGPIIEFTPLKRDVEEKTPPLPPKRIRKAPSVEGFKASQTSVESLLKPGKQIPISRNNEIINRDRSELSVARSESALPPAPKKRSFFSRLFRKRDKSPAPSVKSEGKKEKKSKPVGRSVSSVSGVRPSKFKSAVSHTSLKDNVSNTGLSYADSITHISLHADDNEKSRSQTSLRHSLAPLPPTDGGTILVAESVLALDASQFKKLQDDLDLTDAEHYALYMAVAPHATVSEFDETSCYYSPIDGNPNTNKRKRQKRLIDVSPYLQPVDNERNQRMDYYNEMLVLQRDQKPIKLEPRDKTPPHQVSSPPLTYAQYDRETDGYPWGMHVETMQSNLAIPGPSIVSPYSPHGQEMTWTNLGQAVSPITQTMSPMQSISPNIGHMSPNMGHISPNIGHMSPNMEHVSPNMRLMSPSMGHVSPSMGHVSPSMGHVSPGMDHVSPIMGHVSPGLNQVSPMMQQQAPLPQLQNMMDSQTSTPSISGLLLDRNEMPQLNSSELSGLSSLLADTDREPEMLSDSLNRLSTGDLLRQ